MRIINIFILVSLSCIVSAKYLPDEGGSRALLRNVRSTKDDWDNSVESKSDESNGDDNNDDDKEDNDNDDDDSLEQKRQKEIDKLERKRVEEQRKLQEKREKEEQKQKEQQRKIEAKFFEEKRKLEEKIKKEERKRRENLEKEERKRIEKIAEQERKQQEKLAKEERKRAEEERKHQEKLAKEDRKRQENIYKKTIISQNNPIDSTESEEDIDFEDIWKNYIYEKYGLSQTSTDLEKDAAINKYMQKELGLNANSSKSEYHQAVLQLVQNKLAVQQSDSSSQNSFHNYLVSHVNAVYIQKIQTEIENKIAELDNDTVLLQNVSLPWVPQARYAIEQKRTILTSIAQYLNNILPNWITGSNSTSNTDTTDPNTAGVPDSSSPNSGPALLDNGVSPSNTVSESNKPTSNDLLSNDNSGLSQDTNNAATTSNINPISPDTLPVVGITGSNSSSNTDSTDPNTAGVSDSSSPNLGSALLDNGVSSSSADSESNQPTSNGLLTNNNSALPQDTNNAAITSNINPTSPDTLPVVGITGSNSSSNTDSTDPDIAGVSDSSWPNSGPALLDNGISASNAVSESNEPISNGLHTNDNSALSQDTNNADTTNNINPTSPDTLPVVGSDGLTTPGSVLVTGIATEGSLTTDPTSTNSEDVTGAGQNEDSNIVNPITAGSNPSSEPSLAVSTPTGTSSNSVSVSDQTLVSNNTFTSDSNLVSPGPNGNVIVSNDVASANNLDVALSGTSNASSSITDLPAKDVTAEGNNNIGVSSADVASTNLDTNIDLTDEVTGAETISANVATNSPNSNTDTTGIMTTGDILTGNQSGNVEHTASEQSDTVTAEKPVGIEVLFPSSDSTSSVEPQLVSNISGASTDDISLTSVSPVNAVTAEETLFNTSNGSETNVVTQNIDASDTIASVNIDTSSTQENMGVSSPSDLLSIDVSTNNAILSSALPETSKIISTGTEITTENIVETTLVVAEPTLNNSEFAPTFVEGSTASNPTVIINIEENSANANGVEVSTSTSADTISVGSAVVTENASNIASPFTTGTLVTNNNNFISTTTIQTAEGVNAVTDKNLVDMAQAGIESSVDNSTDFTNNNNGITPIAEISNTASAGIEVTATSVSDSGASLAGITDPQQPNPPENIIILSNTTSPSPVEEAENTVHVDTLVNNADPSVTTEQAVFGSDPLINDISATITDSPTAISETGVSTSEVSATPVETNLGAAADKANSTNVTISHDVTNSQETVPSITEVSSGGSDTNIIVSSDISIVATEATTISSDSVTLLTDNSINTNAFESSSTTPESVIITEVIPTVSEISINVADLSTATEKVVVATLNSEASAGTSNDNINTFVVTELPITSPKPISDTSSTIDGNISTEPSVLSSIGLDVTVSNDAVSNDAVTNVASVNSEGPTVSSIDAESIVTPVNNIPAQDNNVSVTSGTDIAIADTSVVSTVNVVSEVTATTEASLTAQDNINTSTIIPQEAGAALLEVTQQ